MNLVVAFLLVPFAGMLLIPFLKVKGKGIFTFALLSVNALISGYLAIQSLVGDAIVFSFPGSFITGEIPIRIDALSGWFILIISLVFLTGSFYGLFYMKAYKEQKNNLTLHAIAFLFQYTSLVSICVIQNSFAFLLAWEVMALTSFLVIIFDHEHLATIKAGINYLIQAHFSIVFLMIGFIWVASKTGS